MSSVPHLSIIAHLYILCKMMITNSVFFTEQLRIKTIISEGLDDMKDTLNILIVHNEYQYAGGEDTVVRQDAALLKKHGHNVFFYTRKNEELKTYTKLQKLFLPFTTIFSLKSYKEIRKIIQQNEIEIVHVHNTLPLVSYSTYYAAKKEGCKLVQTIHNFRLVCPNALFYRDGHICEDCLKKGLHHGVKHSCYRGSKAQTAMVALSLKLHRLLGTFKKPDAYIALTAFNKEKISSVVKPEKIFIKPNYLALTENSAETSDSSSAALQEVFDVAPPFSYYIYASRLENVKGIFVLLEAFRNLPDETLLLLGTGPDEDNVKAFLEKHHMNNVKCLGFTPHDNTLALLKQAKALIFPSLWYEGFPMTIVESLACGTPVIASDTPNLTETIRSGENGYSFLTGSSEELCKVLKAFSSLSEEETTALKKNARKTYESRFTEEIIYKKMMEIYQNP